MLFSLPLLIVLLMACGCLCTRSSYGRGRRFSNGSPLLSRVLVRLRPTSDASILALASLALLLVLDVLPLLNDLFKRNLEHQLWDAMQHVCPGDASISCVSHFVIITLVLLVWFILASAGAYGASARPLKAQADDAYEVLREGGVEEPSELPKQSRIWEVEVKECFHFDAASTYVRRVAFELGPWSVPSRCKC